MKFRSPINQKFAVFLGLSIFAHLALMAFFSFVPRALFLSELKKRLNHSIEDKTQDLITQIELINEDQKNKRLYIVEQDQKSLNEESPSESQFLSAQNQKVEKQIQSKNVGKFKNSFNSGSFNPLPQRENNHKVSQAQKLGLNGLSLRNFSEIEKKLKKDKSLKSNTPKSSPLPTSFGDGLSQADDVPSFVEEGNQTLLNTREFVYYSFFVRIKDQLRCHWNPLIRKSVNVIYMRDKKMASQSEKTTSLRVTLDKYGYLEKIELLKTSGYKEIDTAAIQAFRSAAPFLNPPQGILDKDKRIRIMWSFTLLDS